MPHGSGQLEGRLEALERQLSRHAAVDEIRDLVSQFSRALDWLDRKLLDQVIFDDAEIDYGLFKGSGRDFKDFIIEMESALGRRWHYTSQVSIQVNGETARAQSYNFSVAAETVKPGSGSRITQFYGYYVDQFICREGRWGIIYRKYILVSSAELDELMIEGPFASLNQIGSADTRHADYVDLSTNPKFD